MEAMETAWTIKSLGEPSEQAIRALVESGDAEVVGHWRSMLSARPGRWVLWAGGVSGTIGGAVLVLFEPGNTGLMFLSPRWGAGQTREMGRLVSAAAGEAMQRGVVLVQSFLPVESQEKAQALVSGGMERLCTMVYMQRGFSSMSPGPVDEQDIQWIRYDALGDPEAFSAVLLRTYEGSLDCPELTGLLRAQDVLAVHKQTGSFRPDWWWVLRRGRRDVGCLLVNVSAEPETLELVYMGLVPEFRGRRLGRLLLEKVIALGAAGPYQRVRLAVDARNTPARRCYLQAGFAETFRREAFVKYACKQGVSRTS
jgi:ribosomal protein S18 acetylase RimI-like enzyme